MHLPENTGGEFTPPPEGAHVAICYRVIDLGTQQTNWQGQTKHQRKILISWELPDEKMETGEHAGEPFTIHQRYTLSSHEKAALRKDLESWRGKAFTDDEFGPRGTFNIKNLISAPCLLNVLHAHKDGKTYANISSIMRLPKGTPKPEMTNTPMYLSLDAWANEPGAREVAEATFNELSQGLRDTISKSPEYQEMMRRRGGYYPEDSGHPDTPPPESPDDYNGGDDSEIPF